MASLAADSAASTRTTPATFATAVPAATRATIAPPRAVSHEDEARGRGPAAPREKEDVSRFGDARRDGARRSRASRRRRRARSRRGSRRGRGGPSRRSRRSGRGARRGGARSAPTRARCTRTRARRRSRAKGRTRAPDASRARATYTRNTSGGPAPGSRLATATSRASSKYSRHVAGAQGSAREAPEGSDARGGGGGIGIVGAPWAREEDGPAPSEEPKEPRSDAAAGAEGGCGTPAHGARVHAGFGSASIATRPRARASRAGDVSPRPRVLSCVVCLRARHRSPHFYLTGTGRSIETDGDGSRRARAGERRPPNHRRSRHAPRTG